MRFNRSESSMPNELQIFDCDQGSEEWVTCRLGLPTASMFATVLAVGKDGGASLTRKTYLLKLLGEKLTGEPAEQFTNPHTERGHRLEGEARDLYALLTDREPKPVGFMRRGDAGASPDSLIDDNGVLEIKTKLAHLQLDCLLRGRLPPEHKAQCQGQLWISGREWVDFISYWPRLPLFRVRVFRDEAYIETLAKAVDEFNAELAELQTRIAALSQ